VYKQTTNDTPTYKRPSPLLRDLKIATFSLEMCDSQQFLQCGRFGPHWLLKS